MIQFPTSNTTWQGYYDNHNCCIMSSYPCSNLMCTSRQGVFSTYKGLEMHLSKSRECQQFYCQPLSNIEYSIGNCQHKRTKLSPTRTNNQPVAASPILPASPTFLPARISSTDTPIAVQASKPSPSLDYFDLPSSDPFLQIKSQQNLLLLSLIPISSILTNKNVWLIWWNLSTI